MPSQQTLVIIAIFAGVLLVMGGVIAWQRGRMKKLEQPKTGFLGKTLPGLIVSLVLGAGLVGGIFLVTQEETTFETEARLNVKVTYERNLISDNGNTRTYEFVATPIVSSGDTAYEITGEEKFDIFWNFSGPDKESQSEIGVTTTNPSSITVELQKGVYDINILVMYKDPTQDNKTFSETLTDKSVSL
jgi:hypothetical protein